MFLFEKNRIHDFIIHFVGIGGIGMSGIAEIMHNLGYKVQGSDIVENDNIKKLKSYGINVFIGHAAENIQNATYVVISSAIKFDNPEVIAALEDKIPLIRRAEMLAELMRLKYSIAVSGSHGKTTTTSLIACLFEEAGLAPTVINGGIINKKLTNAYIGTGKYLITEADESDATFISIPSTIGVITNIDAEHMDFYKNFENLVGAFRSFITNLPFYGFAVVCIDHPVVRELVSKITERRVLTYGIDSMDANLIAYNINSNVSSSSFDIRFTPPHTKGATIIENIIIPTPGRHNVLNSLAAIAIALELDFGSKVIKQGFKSFHGVKRRFTKICEYKAAIIIDDYAHHPVEIMATLETAKIIASSRKGKIIAIFQPHRYSRLKSLFKEFLECFENADLLYITEVYSAGEIPIENISSSSLVEEFNKSSKKTHATLIKSGDEGLQIAEIIKNVAEPNDIVIMMGAGNISIWANNLPKLLNS